MNKKRIIIMGCLGLVMLVLSIFLSVAYGARTIPLEDVIQTFFDKTLESFEANVVRARIPRTVFGVLAGVAFGFAGNTFQSLLRNSLASPDIIGVSSGASVAAVFCILILGLSGAVVSWILLKGAEFDVPTALRWLSGSLNGAQQQNVPRLFVVTLIAGGVILCLVPHIRMMEMGEEYAVSLGVKTEKIRITAMICAILLISFATATTGPIASVAFLSGPIASRMVGNGRNNMLASGLVGATLIVTADFVGQNFWSVRYPVGVITGLLGAPYLLFLLINMNRKDERKK